MRKLLTIFVITVLILGSFGLSATNADTPDMDGYAIIVGSSGKSYLVEGESEIYTAFVFNSKHEYIDPTELNFTWGMNSYGLVRFNNKDGNTCEIVADNNGLFNLTLIVEGDTVARGGIQIPIIDKEFKIDEKIHMKLLVELSKMSPCNPPCRIEVKSGAECITVRTGEDKHLKDDNFVFYRYVSGCTDPCFFSSGVSKNKFRLEVRDKCDNTGSTIERDDNNEESIFHAGNTPGTCSVAAYYNGSMLKSLLCIKVVDEDNASVVTPKELYFKDVPRWGINPIAKKFNFKSEKLAHIRVKCVDEWVEISPSEYYTGMETNFRVSINRKKLPKGDSFKSTIQIIDLDSNSPNLYVTVHCTANQFIKLEVSREWMNFVKRDGIKENFSHNYIPVILEGDTHFMSADFFAEKMGFDEPICFAKRCIFTAYGKVCLLDYGSKMLFWKDIFDDIKIDKNNFMNGKWSGVVKIDENDILERNGRFYSNIRTVFERFGVSDNHINYNPITKIAEFLYEPGCDE